MERTQGPSSPPRGLSHQRGLKDPAPHRDASTGWEDAAGTSPVWDGKLVKITRWTMLLELGSLSKNKGFPVSPWKGYTEPNSQEAPGGQGLG